MTPWWSYALMTLGFVMLALAMDRHHHLVWRGPSTAGRRWFCRLAGLSMMCVSLVQCVQASGWSTGVVEWVGLSTASLMSVVAVLTVAAAVSGKTPGRGC